MASSTQIAAAKPNVHLVSDGLAVMDLAGLRWSTRAVLRACENLTASGVQVLLTGMQPDMLQELRLRGTLHAVSHGCYRFAPPSSSAPRAG